jgi:O-antigen biosynthesis protein
VVSLDTFKEADTRSGRVWLISNDRPIAESIEAYGEWAQIEIEFLTQFLPNEGLILDIGSHIGIHALAFAAAAPKAIVHAFEPQPQIAALLHRNALAFGSRIIVHPNAVGRNSGTAFISSLSFTQPTNAGAVQVSLFGQSGDFQINITSIDELNLNDVRFMKLDIEGHEAAALQGAAKTISRELPVIFCEVNSIDSAAKVFRAMERHSYDAFFITTPAYNEENYRRNGTNFFGVAHESALLFIPTHRPAPRRLKTTVCSRVESLDDLARLFLETPQYGDEPRFDRNVDELRRQHKALRAENGDLREALRAAKARYSVLARFIRKSDLSVRRRSFRGTLARLLSNTEFAKTCRELSRSGLFDRRWYKRTYHDVSTSMLEPVADYILYGAFEGRQPNRAFNTSYYLDTNADVLSAGINPLLHYVKWGEKENRRPCTEFDPQAYQESHPDVDRSRTLLLKHYLEPGRAQKQARPSYQPKAPDSCVFEALRSKNRRTGAPRIDVIIPVYKGYADTLACIASVLSSDNIAPHELIVIDDQSPDLELSKALDRLAAMGLIKLLRNEQNIGFVRTVNRGMALHNDRDVILLNSDTLVFNDWLDRLSFHAASSRVATVTPFTNNGTICSYPEFCRDNPFELDIPFAELDRIAAKINKTERTEIPTGVGFCMYITRSALNAVGLFDEDAFGKGYGEENDFCVRAKWLDFKNLHALDIFVFHSGETSFGESSPALKKRGLAALLKKHPKYLKAIKEYIKSDPARLQRAKLDVGRLLQNAPNSITFCITHTRGGGIERYLQDRAERLKHTGEFLLLGVPIDSGNRIQLTSVYGRGEFSNLQDFDLGDVLPLADLLQSLGISHIEVHSTVGWSCRILDAIPHLARICHLEFDFVAHDYAAACPQINLINETEIYCGEQGEQQCRRCLLAKPVQSNGIHPDAAKFGLDDIIKWRAAYGRFFSFARNVIAPSTDTARRLKRYFPQIQPNILPHTEVVSPITRRVAQRFSGGMLRVAVIGAIGSHKGSDVLLKCAVDALQRRLPLEFVIIGYANIDRVRWPSNLTVTGPYKEREIFDLLEEQKAHLVLLPSVWPETYCYTLTSAIAAGFAVYAFDFGAPAERLRDNPANVLIPTAMISSPQKINDILLEFASRQCDVVTEN